MKKNFWNNFSSILDIELSSTTYILSISDIEVKYLGYSTLVSHIFKFTDKDIQ